VALQPSRSGRRSPLAATGNYERSGGVLNRTCLPSDIIAFVVFCRLRYRLTPGCLSEILAPRGIAVTYEAIRDWETKLLPIMGDVLRKRRHGTRCGPGVSWYIDETYLRVSGKWTYLYRAVDRHGNLIDAMMSEHRDMEAAKAFFRSAKATMGFRPERVTTDGHGSYPRAIRSVLGKTVGHRTRAYLNNRPEQNHRGIKGRIRCKRGFKSQNTASRFCPEHGEIRDLLRLRRRHNEVVSASIRRFRFARGARAGLDIMQNT